MSGRVDLHLHTTASDGFYTPKELVEKAVRAGFQAISITDHDTLEGYKAALPIAKKSSLELIPGVELSSEFQGKEVHILGYFVDPENNEFQAALQFFTKERFYRAERIIKKLNSMGLALSINEISDQYPGLPIGRPHIAELLLKKEYVKSFQEAFYSYLGNNAPAYEKKVYISPESAFRLISAASGLSFIAHPGNMPEDVLKALIDAGCDGIEVMHPSLSNTQIKFLHELTNNYFLLRSGGSDFHGGKKKDDENFGRFYLRYDEVRAMKSRLTNIVA
jgi:predicted metal-dependent phosphoesterase TrpH